MTQAALAEKCDMKQSALSRLESADYSGWSFKTLRRVAEALDARLQISIEPRMAVIEHYRNMELHAQGFKRVEPASSGRRATDQYQNIASVGVTAQVVGNLSDRLPEQTFMVSNGMAGNTADIVAGSQAVLRKEGNLLT